MYISSSPNYFKKVKISAVALLKMVRTILKQMDLPPACADILFGSM